VGEVNATGWTVWGSKLFSVVGRNNSGSIVTDNG
jgi:hypothetical protein